MDFIRGRSKSLRQNPISALKAKEEEMVRFHAELVRQLNFNKPLIVALEAIKNAMDDPRIDQIGLTTAYGIPWVKLEETQNHLAMKLLDELLMEYKAYNKEKPIKKLALEKLESMNRFYAHIEAQIIENNRQILITRKEIHELETSQRPQKL